MKSKSLVSEVYQSTQYRRELWKKNEVKRIRQQIEKDQFQIQEKEFFNYLRRMDVVKRKDHGHRCVLPRSNKQLKGIYDVREEFRYWKQIQDEPKNLYPKPKVILRKGANK